MVKVHSCVRLQQGVDAASASFLANGKIGVAAMPRHRGSCILLFVVSMVEVHYLRFDFFIHVCRLLLLLIEVLADGRFSGCH
jgi:hypothetical protein